MSDKTLLAQTLEPNCLPHFLFSLKGRSFRSPVHADDCRSPNQTVQATRTMRQIPASHLSVWSHVCVLITTPALGFHGNTQSNSYTTYSHCKINCKSAESSWTSTLCNVRDVATHPVIHSSETRPLISLLIRLIIWGSCSTITRFSLCILWRCTV